MPSHRPPPLIEVRGVLGEVLPDIFRNRIGPLLAERRDERVWMAVSTDAGAPLDAPGRETFFRLAGEGRPAEFSWKARGTLYGVVRRFRLELLRQLGPAEMRCRACVAMWIDDCGLTIDDCKIEPVLPNRRSPIPDPQSSNVQPQSPISNPQSSIVNRQSAIPNRHRPPEDARALPGNFYQDYYGFERMPFNNTPDTYFYFPTEKHQEALSRLIYAVSERKGFVMISGEIGAGKSTLCRALLGQIPRTVKTALVTHTHLDAGELLRVIAEDLGLVTGGLARHEVVHALHEYLVRQLAADCTVCIIIDEAQNLSADALEELRMISNLETEREKLVQLILLGQPGLRETMGLPRLKQLRQRVAVQFHLEPLTRGETFGYIAHRLKKAGPKRKVRFPRAVMDEVWRYSGGVPRVINTLCDSALLSGFTQRTTKITRRMVREASRDLDLAPQHGGLAQFFKFW